MRNKTAMMELIEKLENNIERFDDDPILNRIFKLCANTAKQLLEKEKEQIIMAYDNGRYSSLQYNKTPIEYYNQNYLKEVQDEAK